MKGTKVAAEAPPREPTHGAGTTQPYRHPIVGIDGREVGYIANAFGTRYVVLKKKGS